MLIFESRGSLNEAQSFFKGDLGKAASNAYKPQKDQLARYLSKRGVDLGMSASSLIQVKNTRSPELKDANNVVFGVIKVRSGSKMDYKMVVYEASTGKTIVDTTVSSGSTIVSNGTEYPVSKYLTFSKLSWKDWVKYIDSWYILDVTKNQSSGSSKHDVRASQRAGSSIDIRSKQHRNDTSSDYAQRSIEKGEIDKSGYRRDPTKYARQKYAGADPEKLREEALDAMQKAFTQVTGDTFSEKKGKLICERTYSKELRKADGVREKDRAVRSARSKYYKAPSAIKDVMKKLGWQVTDRMTYLDGASPLKSRNADMEDWEGTKFTFLHPGSDDIVITYTTWSSRNDYHDADIIEVRQY